MVSPLDVLKVRWQLSRHDTSLFSTLRHILESHGWSGLFRGNAWGIALWMSYGAVQFPAYEMSKSHLGGETILSRILSGSLAATVATTLTFPFDSIRTRRISTTGHNYSNIFRGLTPGLISIAPMSGTTFALYEQFEDLGMDKATSGFLSGVIARTIFFPLDTIKRRLMTQGFEHIETKTAMLHYSGTLHCAKTMFREEGIRAFFKGISPSLVKTGLGSSVTFFVYETVVHLLNSKKKQEIIRYDD